MKKNNLRKLFINKTVIISLLICGGAGYVLKNNNNSVYAIKDLNKALNSLEMSDANDELFEAIYSSKQFEKGNEFYICNQSFLDYDKTTPYDITENILNNTENSELTNGTEVIDEKYHSSIESAISNSWDNCPVTKKDSFYHLLKELKIVESPSNGNNAISGEYDDETKTIKIYSDKIKEYLGEVYSDSETVETEEDRIINNTICHEMNHVVQDTCSCDKSDNKLCLNNKTLWEADAEEYNIYSENYILECKIYNLVRMTAIFNEELDVDYFHDLLVNNDIDKLYTFFGAETKKEKYDVYRLLSIINIYPNTTSNEVTTFKEELTEDLDIQLLKYFCKNLANFINTNNISMEEAIYFFKGYLSNLLSFNYYDEATLKLVDKYEIIIDAFTTYLSTIYDTDFNIVTDKLLSVDIYHELSDSEGNVVSIEGLVPKSTLNILPSDKIKYLGHEFDIYNESFLKPANNSYYNNECNFKYANNLLNLLIDQKELTYKKEK